MVKKIKKNQLDKQLIWIIASMTIALLCLVAIPLVIKYKNNINYEGLKFQKVKYGQLDIYYYSYHFSYLGNSYSYKLYIRNNPENNKVPVNGTINYPLMGSEVFVSFDFNNFANCSNSIREVTTLSLFLEGNLFKTNLSSPDLDYSRKYNISYANCMSPTNRMVILIQKGNETRIDRYKTCYVLTTKNCDEMLNVIEKFEVQSIVDAKK